MKIHTENDRSDAITAPLTATAITKAQLVDAAKKYARAATAPATRKAYAHDWQAFETWCAANELQALPSTPETVALYATSLAESGRKVAGIQRALAAIATAHKTAGRESPCRSGPVRLVMNGIKRTHGVAQRKASALLPEHLRSIVESLPKSLGGIRDRALLLVGFGAALRRSELAQLRVEHLKFSKDGLEIFIARSKTDQEGEGERVGIPRGEHEATCPVRALGAWLRASAISSGPVFRRVFETSAVGSAPLNTGSIARIVKRAVKRAEMDNASYSAHSLRAGMVTAAARAGVAEYRIAKHTRHASPAVLRGYIRDVDVMTANPLRGLGL